MFKYVIQSSEVHIPLVIFTLSITSLKNHVVRRHQMATGHVDVVGIDHLRICGSSATKSGVS